MLYSHGNETLQKGFHMRKYLIDLRTKRELSQQDVASQLGITRQYYQQIEAGDRQKRIDVLLLSSLAEIFELSLNEIVTLEQMYQHSEQQGA